MSYAPCLGFSMLQCPDDAPVTIDEFSKGVVTVLTGGCPSDLTWDADTITAWAGATLTNTLEWIYSYIAYALIESGPGSIDSLYGEWSWASSPGDSGIHIVTGGVHNAFCFPSICNRESFVIDLLPLVPGDLNCDGVVNVLDVVTEVNTAFRGDPPPVPCWDR